MLAHPQPPGASASGPLLWGAGGGWARTPCGGSGPLRGGVWDVSLVGKRHRGPLPFSVHGCVSSGGDRRQVRTLAVAPAHFACAQDARPSFLGC